MFNIYRAYYFSGFGNELKQTAKYQTTGPEGSSEITLWDIEYVNDPLLIATSQVINPADKKDRKIKQKGCNRMLINLEKSHTSPFGKQVPDRKMEVLDPCAMKCSERIDKEDCVKCYKDYWSLRNIERRALYISHLITISPKKRIGTHNPFEKRLYSCTYKLTGKDILICQKCFLKTLGENISFVNTVIEKKKKIWIDFYERKRM